MAVEIDWKSYNSGHLYKSLDVGENSNISYYSATSSVQFNLLLIPKSINLISPVF